MLSHPLRLCPIVAQRQSRLAALRVSAMPCHHSPHSTGGIDLCLSGLRDCQPALSAALRPVPTTVAPAWTKRRRLVQRHALVPAVVFPIARYAPPMRDWQAAGVKHEATTDRLDVLEAAVLPMSEALPPPERVPASHYLADPPTPAADAAAAPTPAAAMAALSR